jgi:hypothetical protein
MDPVQALVLWLGTRGDGVHSVLKVWPSHDDAAFTSRDLCFPSRVGFVATGV